jgi:hypothetical protein
MQQRDPKGSGLWSAQNGFTLYEKTIGFGEYLTVMRPMVPKREM